MPRFAALSLVNLRVELARERVDAEDKSGAGGPVAAPVLAVVVARPGRHVSGSAGAGSKLNGAVKDETSLLGNTRLDEVSPEAFALGIRLGQTIAAARARSSDLRVRVVPLFAVKKALEGVAEAALAFGPTTAFEAGGFAGDVVWVDVTGCGHLHEGESAGANTNAIASASASADASAGAIAGPQGERALLARLVSKVESMGHSCRAAIADGPRIAAAVARFSGVRAPVVVAEGENATALGKLPLAALGLEAKARAWLSALGLRRVADLQKLPRSSLGTRLGKDGERVMALLHGDDRAALVAYVPPEVPTEEVELEYGIESAEALLFVAKRLARGLSSRLEGRCLKATRLDLVLRLDCREQGETSSSIFLAAPIVREEDLFSVLKTKIEAQDREGPFAAPIVAVTLCATETVFARAEPLDLLVPEAKAERSLPKLASELAAELGHEAVGTLALADSWVMEDRSRLVPFGVKRPVRSGIHARDGEGDLASFLSGGVEPTRLLVRPFVVKRSELSSARLVARSEAIEWWRREAKLGGAPRAGTPGAAQTRVDHYMAWVDSDGTSPARPERGRNATAWVELDPRTEMAKVLGWVD